MIQGQRLAVKGSRFKLRGSRLVDAEPMLLGVFTGYGSNWAEGWGLCLGVVVPRTWDGVMDGQRRSGVFSFFTTSGLVSAVPYGFRVRPNN